MGLAKGRVDEQLIHACIACMPTGQLATHQAKSLQAQSGSSRPAQSAGTVQQAQRQAQQAQQNDQQDGQSASWQWSVPSPTSPADSRAPTQRNSGLVEESGSSERGWQPERPDSGGRRANSGRGGRQQ